MPISGYSCVWRSNRSTSTQPRSDLDHFHQRLHQRVTVQWDCESPKQNRTVAFAITRRNGLVTCLCDRRPLRKSRLTAAVPQELCELLFGDQDLRVTFWYGCAVRRRNEFTEHLELLVKPEREDQRRNSFRNASYHQLIVKLWSE